MAEKTLKRFIDRLSFNEITDRLHFVDIMTVNKHSFWRFVTLARAFCIQSTLNEGIGREISLSNKTTLSQSEFS